MSTWYSAITLSGPDPNEVVQFLKRTNVDAYVTYDNDGFTTVFERESDLDHFVLQDLAAGLSAAFSCGAIAVTVADTVFVYFLYESGRLVDLFNSDPDVFDWGMNFPERGGNGKTISIVFDTDGIESELEEILDRDTRYADASNRHANLFEVLGISHDTIGLGYRYLQEEGLPDKGVFVLENADLGWVQ